MNSAIVAALAALLAVANAGLIGAPAVAYTGAAYHAPLAYSAAYAAPLAYHAAPLAYHAAPAAVSHSYYSGVTRSSHLIAAASPLHHLVRVARGIYSGLHAPLTTYAAAPVAYAAHAAPLAYAAHAAPVAYAAHAAPLAYAAPAVHAPLAYTTSALVSRSYHGNPLLIGGPAHIRVARGIYSGLHAPLTTYAAAPVAYAAPVAKSVAYSSTVVHAAAPVATYAAPVATYAAHAAPLAYAAHAAPLAYAAAPAYHAPLAYGYSGLYGATTLLKK